MPVRILLAENVGERLNMPHHRLDRKLLIEELVGLVERDYMLVRFRDNFQPEDRPTSTRSLRGLLDAEPEAEGDLVLTLTKEGGAAWERYAQPDWLLYLENDVSEIIQGRVHFVVRGVTKRVVEVFGDLAAYWGHFPKSGHVIKPIGQWRALGWKDFQEGFELTIDSGVSPDSPEGKEYETGLMGTNGWFRDLSMFSLSLWSLHFQLELGKLRELSR
jgi:hypothetical protein